MSKSYNGKWVWYDKERTEKLQKNLSKIHKSKGSVYDLTQNQLVKLVGHISGRVIRCNDINWRRRKKVTVFCMACHRIDNDVLSMDFYDSCGKQVGPEYISIRNMRIIKDFDFLTILDSNDSNINWNESIGAFVKQDITKWWDRFFRNMPEMPSENNTYNIHRVMLICDMLYLNCLENKSVWFKVMRPYYKKALKSSISKNGNFIQPNDEGSIKLVSFFDGNNLDKWLTKPAVIKAINRNPMVKEWVQKHCPKRFLADFAIACLQK